MKCFALLVCTLLFSCLPVLQAPIYLPTPAEIQPGSISVPAPKLLSRAEVHELIETAAEKHNLPLAFVKSIVAAESAFRSDAVSSKGALGLMQVMPSTAMMFGWSPAMGTPAKASIRS